MYKTWSKFVVGSMSLTVAIIFLSLDSMALPLRRSEVFQPGQQNGKKPIEFEKLISTGSFTHEQKLRLQALYQHDNFRNLIVFLRDFMEGVILGDQLDSLIADLSKQDYASRDERNKVLGIYRKSILTLEVQLLSHVGSADSIPPFVTHTFSQMLDLVSSRQFTEVRFNQLVSALKEMVENIETQKMDLNSYLNIDSNLGALMQFSKDLLAENNATLPPHSISNRREPGYVYDYFEYQPIYFNP